MVKRTVSLSAIVSKKINQTSSSRIEQEDCPVVFCHNDMQEGNILMSLDQDKENNSKSSELIIIGMIMSLFLRLASACILCFRFRILLLQLQKL